jgi:hypothetical protein
MTTHLRPTPSTSAPNPQPRDAMTDVDTDDAGLADRRMASTLRRCWLQPSRPIGITADEEQAATDAGLMRFVEGTYRGRYSITAAGHEFLREH